MTRSLLLAACLSALVPAIASAAPVRIGAGDHPSALYLTHRAEIAYTIDDTTTGYCAIEDDDRSRCAEAAADLKIPAGEVQYGPLAPRIAVSLDNSTVIIRPVENRAVYAWVKPRGGAWSDADGNAANGHQATKLYSEGPKGNVRDVQLTFVEFESGGRGEVVTLAWAGTGGAVSVMAPRLDGADAARSAITTLPGGPAFSAEIEPTDAGMVLTASGESAVTTSVLPRGKDPAQAASWSAPLRTSRPVAR